MNKTTALRAAITIGALAAIASATANATPIQYAFYANLILEQNAYNLPALLAPGTAISGHFSFEPDAAAVLTNAADPGALSDYGLYSIYFGAIQQLSGHVGSHAFSATSGSTLVANSDIGGSTAHDGVFNIAGNLNGDEVGTGFTGFSIDGFTLKSFNLFSVGGQHYLSSQALPGELTQGDINTGINLIFQDAQQRERTLMFWTAEITPVPVPAAAWLFGTAIAGLAAAGRKARR